MQRVIPRNPRILSVDDRRHAGETDPWGGKQMRTHTLKAGLAVAMLGAGTAVAQTGSYWEGVVDANIPVNFHAESFTDESIAGSVRFGSSWYGFADDAQLCDRATLTAKRHGDHYAYRISGACRGKGKLTVSADDPDHLDGLGTIYDASSAGAAKRRSFYLERK